MTRLRLTVRSLFVLVALAVSAATALAGPEGRYSLSGVNPGGSGTYRGNVTVTPLGEAYEVTWRIGNSRYNGVGVFSDGVLSIAYYGSNLTGVAVYREQSDGSWRGEWAVLGSGRLGKENWVPR